MHDSLIAQPSHPATLTAQRSDLPALERGGSREAATTVWAAPIAGATLLRIAFGSLVLAHGLLKIMVYKVPGTVAFFEGVGFPGWTAYLVIAGEVLGGLALLAGVLVRPASLALLPIFAGVLSLTWRNGWVFNAPNGGGWEFPALLMVLAVVQALLGPGRFALGPVLRRANDRS